MTMPASHIFARAHIFSKQVVHDEIVPNVVQARVSLPVLVSRHLAIGDLLPPLLDTCRGCGFDCSTTSFVACIAVSVP